MDNSKGRYWDKPWSLISSCTRCSPGCQHCWSLAMEKRFHKGVEGQIVIHPERLDIPLRTRKPTVFAIWNDLFHEDVPDEFIVDALLEIDHARVRGHKLLVLTKRPRRMAECINGLLEFSTNFNGGKPTGYPREHVWFGVTVCNQAEADTKIPELLKVPGKKWLSIEPMLSEIWLPASSISLLPTGGTSSNGAYCPGATLPRIDAVVLGGESGPGARPLHPDWVRGVRDQCAAANTPFYFKQWGEWGPKAGEGKYAPQCFVFGDGLGDVPVFRVGSKRAGRLIDGREWNELPWRTA